MRLDWKSASIAGALALGGALQPSGALAAVEAAAVGDAVELRESGRRLGVVKLVTAPGARGRAVVKTVEVAGRRVIELRVPVAGQPSAESQSEIWIGELPAGGGALRPVWSGLVGPEDADGETRRDVEVSPAGVVEYQSALRLQRCDGKLLRLFPRAFDFEAGKFRDMPPPLPPPAAQRIRARRDDPAAPKGRPRGGFHFVGASSERGLPALAKAQASPAAVGDGDPQTVWIEGAAGDGGGETLLARTGAGPVTVTGVRVLPGDARSATGFRAHGRPRVLSLILGAGADQRFDVELPDESPPGDPLRPFWVPLPRPVATTCLSVVLREVTPGTGATAAAAAISDIDVFTELDGPQGLTKLLAALASGDGCEARVHDAVSFGADAVPMLASAIIESSPQARHCLLDVLDRITGAAGGTPTVTRDVMLALSHGLRGATRQDEKLVVAVASRLRDEPLEPLEKLLADDTAAPADRGRAARVLGALPRADGRAALLAALGRPPAEVRAAVRTALGGASHADLPAALLQALDGGGAAEDTSRRADLVLLLGEAAPRIPDAAGPVTARLRTLVTAPDEPFEVKARAIEALGKIRGHEAARVLLGVRAAGDDPVLRYFAVRELDRSADPAATAALRAAVDDADPRVREAASVALMRRRDVAAGALLLAAAKQEPWPFVRRAEVRALARLCVPGSGDLFVRANERDVDEVRKVGLMGLVSCRDPRAAQVLLAVLGRALEPAGLRALAADQLAALEDRKTAPEIAAALDRLINESQADLSLEGVAVGALNALVALRAPDAVRGAERLLGDDRPALRRSAVDALGRLCDPGAGAAVLRKASADPDEDLALAARGAERACASRRP